MTEVDFSLSESASVAKHMSIQEIHDLLESCDTTKMEIQAGWIGNRWKNSVVLLFLALDVSCGFGAGMGCLQGACGAVTGAYMVLGIYCSKKFKDNGARKAQSYLMVQAFNKRFIEKHRTTDCSGLLNCDLKAEQGQQFFQDNHLMKNVCKVCISDAIELINEQIIGSQVEL